MSEFKPVSTLEDLATLDTEEILEGYRSGADGDPEPGNNRSRSFWHGWRNGAMDAGALAHDQASHDLAALYIADMRIKSRAKVAN